MKENEESNENDKQFAKATIWTVILEFFTTLFGG